MTTSTISSNVQQPPITLSSQGTTVDSSQEAKKKFAKFALEALQRICQDHQNRIEAYQNNNDVLENGIYPPITFYRILKELRETTSINYFKSGYHFMYGLVPMSYFEYAGNPANPRAFCGFRLRAHTSPAEGLEALCDGLTLMDSASACYLAYHIALAKLLGEVKYNALFDNQSTTPLVIEPNFDPINLLFRILERPSQVNLQPGQIVLYSNVDGYYDKHYCGDMSGMSVICTNEQGQFIGLGLDPKSVSVEQITNALIENYNKPHVNDELLTTEMIWKIERSWSEKEKIEVEQLASDQINTEQFRANGGGRIEYTLEINEDRIFRLACASIDEVGHIMNVWLWLDEQDD